LDDFVKTFDTNLQEKVTSTLMEWQASGFLTVIINEALQTEIDEVKHAKKNLIYIEDAPYNARAGLDSTAAFTLACNELPAGSVVVIPKGQFNINGKLNGEDRVRFIGQGKGITI
jgi:hypothetical protein